MVRRRRIRYTPEFKAEALRRLQHTDQPISAPGSRSERERDDVASLDGGGPAARGAPAHYRRARRTPDAAPRSAPVAAGARHPKKATACFAKQSE
jgi:hypothetical protein